MHHITDN